jgi:hypothetical protein
VLLVSGGEDGGPVVRKIAIVVREGIPEMR